MNTAYVPMESMQHNVRDEKLDHRDRSLEVPLILIVSKADPWGSSG